MRELLEIESGIFGAFNFAVAECQRTPGERQIWELNRIALDHRLQLGEAILFASYQGNLGGVGLVDHAVATALAQSDRLGCKLFGLFESTFEQCTHRKSRLGNSQVLLPQLAGHLRIQLDLAVELRRRANPARVVIVTTFARSGFLQRALAAGAAGYLLKDSPAERLADAVRRVHAGLRAIDPELATAAWDELDPLTERERQVLRLAGEGMSTASVAAELHLSEGTVRNYLSEAIGKLGAANRAEAARIARGKGWL